jgi:hypothetical protein
VTAPRTALIRFEASLVEEAVLIRIDKAPTTQQREFRRRRDAIYEHGDPEEREARFEAFHGECFTRLGLDRPLREALQERPSVLPAVTECRVLRASTPRMEMADLVERDAAGTERILVIRLGPASLVDGGLLAWLRRELLHVADMLDPRFGYLPSLSRSLDEPPDNLLRDRYRVVWDVTVAGRLLRQGLDGASSRERARREFERVFSWLGDEAGGAFDGWFEEPAPTHDAIVRFIKASRALAPRVEAFAPTPRTSTAR